MVPETRETTRTGRRSAGPSPELSRERERKKRGEERERKMKRRGGSNQFIEDWKRNGLPTCLGFKG